MNKTQQQLNTISEPRSGNGRASAQKYLSAVVSQGLVSGFHFILNLTLVRLLDLSDFGTYALAFVCAILTSSISNALISTPLCIYAPAASSTAERRKIEATLTTMMSFLLGAILMIGVVATLGSNFLQLDTKVLVVMIGFILSYLARQYSRSFGYSRFDVMTVLYGDVTYVTSGVILLVLTTWNVPNLTVVHVLSILSLANLFAITCEIVMIKGSLAFLTWKNALTGYEAIWLQTRWALLGSLTTVIVSQSHSIVVSSTAGAAAYAPLAAGFVIFGPVRVIFTTIQNVIKPEMSMAIANNQINSAMRQMIMASILSTIAVAALILITFFSWPIIDQLLYQEKYSASPMKTIVFLWAAITLIGAMQNGPFAALQAFKAFQPLAMVTVYASILSLGLVSIILAFFTVPYTLVGILITELIVAVWVIRMVHDRINPQPSNPLAVNTLQDVTP